MLFTVVGVAAIASLVAVVHAGALLVEVHRALRVMPFVVALEGGMLAFEMAAVWRLYGTERRAIPLRDLVHAGLLGYPAMVLMPAGRTVAEGVRAGFLKQRVGAPLATAVAVEMQSVLLIAIGLISATCAVCMIAIGGTRALVLAVTANAVLTGAAGIVIVAVRRRTRIGGWLAKRFKRLQAGAEIDQVLRTRPTLPALAVVLALCGRCCQVGEVAVLFYAIAGHVGFTSAFAVEGINLVGTTLGDLFPSGLGATDAAFTYAGPGLGITASGGLAIALLMHATQAVGCVICAFAPAVFFRRHAS